MWTVSFLNGTTLVSGGKNAKIKFCSGGEIDCQKSIMVLQLTSGRIVAATNKDICIFQKIVWITSLKFICDRLTELTLLLFFGYVLGSWRVDLAFLHLVNKGESIVKIQFWWELNVWVAFFVSGGVFGWCWSLWWEGGFPWV